MNNMVEKTQWVSVKDRLHEEVESRASAPVIVKTDSGHWYQSEYWYGENVWLNLGLGSCRYIQGVTHWLDPKTIK
jgi:hypothetical protein